MNERRNSEGYLDMTAYLAMNSIRGKDMKRGDIVNIISTQSSRQGIVIQAFGTYVVYLMLLANMPEECPMQISSADGYEYWVDLGKLNFAYYDKLSETSYYFNQDVCDKVIKGIANAIGFTVGKQSKQPDVDVSKYVDEIESLRRELERKDSEPKKTDESEELVKWKTKAEIFEGLYKDMMRNFMED